MLPNSFLYIFIPNFIQPREIPHVQPKRSRFCYFHLSVHNLRPHNTFIKFSFSFWRDHMFRCVQFGCGYKGGTNACRWAFSVLILLSIWIEIEVLGTFRYRVDSLFAELGPEQKKHRRIRRRTHLSEVYQVPTYANVKLETGNGKRQHVPASFRVHQRFPVGVMSAARVRAAVSVDDQTVHRVGLAKIRHDQPLLSSDEVRTNKI